jgi:hypothetical protein
MKRTKVFKFRALISLETAAHGGPVDDLPSATVSLVLRGHREDWPRTKIFTALLSTDDGEPLHAGDNHRTVTFSTSDTNALDFFGPGGRFDLWQGHDLGHGTVTRRLLI